MVFRSRGVWELARLALLPRRRENRVGIVMAVDGRACRQDRELSRRTGEIFGDWAVGQARICGLEELVRHAGGGGGLGPRWLIGETGQQTKARHRNAVQGVTMTQSDSRSDEQQQQKYCGERRCRSGWKSSWKCRGSWEQTGHGCGWQARANCCLVIARAVRLCANWKSRKHQKRQRISLHTPSFDDFLGRTATQAYVVAQGESRPRYAAVTVAIPVATPCRPSSAAQASSRFPKTSTAK